jgi:hypothetical protein
LVDGHRISSVIGGMLEKSTEHHLKTGVTAQILQRTIEREIDLQSIDRIHLRDTLIGIRSWNVGCSDS